MSDLTGNKSQVGGSSGGGNIMGAIPRKKLPPLQQSDPTAPAHTGGGGGGTIRPGGGGGSSAGLPPPSLTSKIPRRSFKQPTPNSAGGGGGSGSTGLSLLSAHHRPPPPPTTSQAAAAAAAATERNYFQQFKLKKRSNMASPQQQQLLLPAPLGRSSSMSLALSGTSSSNSTSTHVSGAGSQQHHHHHNQVPSTGPFHSVDRDPSLSNSKNKVGWPNRSYMDIVSEQPLVMRIQLTAIPALDLSIQRSMRIKRPRNYQELRDTDSEEEEGESGGNGGGELRIHSKDGNDDDDENMKSKPVKKRRRSLLSPFKGYSPNTTAAAVTASSPGEPVLVASSLLQQLESSTASSGSGGGLLAISGGAGDGLFLTQGDDRKEPRGGAKEGGNGNGDNDEDDETAHESDLDILEAAAHLTQPAGVPTIAGMDAAAAAAAGIVVDVPPPGVLSALWYSRECFCHIFVLEKVVGWKLRPKLQLVDDTGSVVTPIDAVAAAQLQQRILAHPAVWADPRKRMEVSRIMPLHCPAIVLLASLQEEHAAKSAGRTPAYTLAEAAKEEVLLVKWRGRSHLHCSWERASDVQRQDTSNNSTARNKIRRFYQTQEQVLGTNWKTVMEEERAIATKLHAVHAAAATTAGEDGDELSTATPALEQPEEYFSTQCLEVERIIACDESEMNMQVLAKQRAMNIRDEQEAVRRRDIEGAAAISAAASSAVAAAAAMDSGSSNSVAISFLREMVQDLITPSPQVEETVDPEDNVRYVVKWKGLPFTEMTWEYWREIKRDAVDEAEDFWYRQRAPDLADVKQNPHPDMKDFRKLLESPLYGVSALPRPIAKLEGNSSDTNSAASLPNSSDDEEGSFQGFKLRGYQLEGVNWLLFNWWNRRSCILADEMGLGKTIQSAAFLRTLQTLPATQIRGPFLIVAPLSLVGQWQSELKSWAPDMNVVLYHGSADARDFLVKQEFYYTDQFAPKSVVLKLKRQNVTKFHVLITTYEVILKDLEVLAKIRWRTLIVDEAHRLKNSKTRLFELLASLPRDYCALLTGTPIANATEELWALLHFANPKVFSNKDEFLEKFGEMTDAKQVGELHSLLKPYLLRRVKEDVEKSLPPKEETILEVTLTPIQKTFYKAIYERNTSFLFKGAKPSNAPSLMNVMMELRKCCNHPYLVKGAEERILNDAAARIREKAGSDFAAVDFVKLFGEHLVKSSGKMVLMEKLLQKLFVGGHKVLIFSQMVRVLDLLEELLKLRKYRYERLDGSTSSSSRVHAVDRFNKKSCQRFVMLLSTRAGGLGLNLTAADVVIIFDSDWNPQNDLQAMARAHRIGQTRAVRVYRLLTAKTYEMHMFHSASLKLGLERAVLSQNREQNDDTGDDKSSSKRKNDREMQAKEIDELLKKGAYDVFRDDDDTEAEKFMETDIDHLLESSAKKVTYGASASDSLGTTGLGSFSKASFVANTDDGAKDVDLDDPDFWAKAVGLEAPEETPEEVAAMIDDGVKRSRKQVQVYDPYAETKEAEQRKKDLYALEKQMEREEKERLRLEKKRKKKEAKEKKRREREEELKNKQAEKLPKIQVQKESKEQLAHQQQQKEQKIEKQAVAASPAKASKDSKEAPEHHQPAAPAPAPKKALKDLKPKKSKKNDRLRAIRRAENEDPVLERLKQAWEAPQRARATAAGIRFGFGRFCKIRNESNLPSLPLQDVECFFRSFVYQLSLQAAYILLVRLRDKPQDERSRNFRRLFMEWLGGQCDRELDWICDSVRSVMSMHIEVEQRRRFLRMPFILTEPTYVDELRRGGALRALRRVALLSRLNRVVQDCLDSILSAFGHEELGKRGCAANDLASLDPDLKSRFVTTEELTLAIGSVLKKLDFKMPASWWDRNCDIALIVGSFVHGLGNYEAMRNDRDLPFAHKIGKWSRRDAACRHAAKNLRVVARAARQVFDDALEAGRIKAELEVQAAVAAAAKAASKREEDAALLRKGGAEAEAVISTMPDTQVENAFAYDGTDSHFVTLPRMLSYLHEAVRKEAAADAISKNPNDASLPEPAKGEEDQENQEDGTSGSSGRVREHHQLPMPDSRTLDHRLLHLLREVEASMLEPSVLDAMNLDHANLWEKSDSVATNLQVRAKHFAQFFDDVDDILSEYAGIGFGASQCGTSHRSLNDGSNYSYGSASSQLAQVAYGTDAPRFLRALGVPMNVSRFAVTGLVYAENSFVQELLRADRLRYYGKEDGVGVIPDSGAPIAVEVKVSEDSPNTSRNENQSELVAASDHLHHDNTRIRQVAPIDPADLIPDAFRLNPRLRANVCIAVIFYGFPRRELEMPVVDAALWSSLHQATGLMETASPPELFDENKFRDIVQNMDADLDIPEISELRDYVETVLLPHCLRLCINGNGSTTRNARGSQGEYETAFGVSVDAEPSQPHPSPIPDPCLKLHEHSLEALGLANAVLRRVRLLRSSIFICSGKEITSHSLSLVAKSKFMRDVPDMPIWWCPWIHDVALVVEAATGGLFSVLRSRSDHFIFSPQSLQHYLYASFVSDDRGGLSAIAKHASPEEVTAWTERQADQFPTLYQLERRLSFLCSQATAAVEHDDRFDNLPMFDHGGWPRK